MAEPVSNAIFAPRPSQLMTDKKLCFHCGEDDTFGDFDGDYHLSCREAIDRCNEAVTEFPGFSQVKHVLCTGINVLFLYGQGIQLKKEAKRIKKKKRNRKETELLKKVSAMRNSNSGVLLIQLVGLSPEDSFTGAFDEFADPKLNEIIEDGKLFCHVFRKTRMKDIRGLEEYKEFMVLYVEGASHVTSSSLKTKVPLDFSIEDPSPRTLGQYLKDAKQFDESFPNATFSLEELKQVRENRSIQLKTSVGNNLTVTELWEHYRLGEYISAFSKNGTGGCLLVGIKEEDKNVLCVGSTLHPSYTSKEIYVHGATYENQVEIETQLKDKANKLLVCGYRGEPVRDPDLIQVRFIPVGETKKVLLIEVRPVRGVVFYDEKGPLAYRIPEEETGPRLVEIDRQTWFKLMDRI